MDRNLDRNLDEHSEKPPVSATLHRVGRAAGHELSVALVIGALAAWLVAWLATGRHHWMLAALEAVAASVTLVMVFVLQHAQHRLEIATQLKLDELLRAVPRADDALVKAEAGSDAELRDRIRHNLRYREGVRSDAVSPRDSG